MKAYYKLNLIARNKKKQKLVGYYKYTYDFKYMQNLNINISTTKPVDIYYKKDGDVSLSNYNYKFINVTTHNFSIADNLSSKLNILICKYNTATTLTITNNYSLASNNKYAIIIGISDYKSISDLNYCDEDASDWANYLLKLGYNCVLYGDTHTKNYPFYNGIATEANVRAMIQKISKLTDDNSKILIISSGHGGGDGNGNSFLCMYDYNGQPNGKYTDKEFYSDITLCKGQKFVFLDHCFSGGLLDELKNIDNIFATSTCTEKGYGYDVEQFKNGAWTYCFLQKAIIDKYSNTQISLQDIYTYANSIYKSVTDITNQNDQPMAISTCQQPFYL